MKFSRIRSIPITGQFLLFGIGALVVGMLTIGLWIHNEIKREFIERTADATALFVDSVLSHHVQGLKYGNQLDAASLAALDDHLDGTPLGRDFATIKLWAPDGTIVYSTDRSLTGRRFELEDDLVRAFRGEVVSHMTELTEPESVQERLIAGLLIETYVPVTEIGTTDAVAVAEFYQRADALLDAIARAQRRGWAIVGSATAVMYLMLVGLARGAARLIRSQSEDLEQNVAHLSELVALNRTLHERTRGAAGRATAINERFLRQISADLHDGPAQNVALAKMRVDALDYPHRDRVDLATISTVLDNALTDIRSIASGLRSPDIDGLSLTETADKAIGAFKRATGTEVESQQDKVPETAPLSVRITVYRVLQETLANSYKHAPGAARRVALKGTTDALVLDMEDDGPGFDLAAGLPDEALGLAGMRERVEMLGGSFEIITAPGDGTRIRVTLPLEDTAND